jgi:phospholipid/cholesterol/gamma-HCH transport system substrate-binding protein
MLPTMSEAKSKTEILVGLFLLIGLGLLGALIVTFGRFDDRFAGHYSLTVIFDDAAGLIRGSEVRMGGARIGKVSGEPELTDEVKVRVPIRPSP